MTIKLDQKYKENERLEQALIDWDKEQIPFTIQQYLEHPFERTYTAEQMMDFARYYAQRCNVNNMLCGSFDPDTTTSSATKCKCGREKWEHPKAT